MWNLFIVEHLTMMMTYKNFIFLYNNLVETKTVFDTFNDNILIDGQIHGLHILVTSIY